MEELSAMQLIKSLIIIGLIFGLFFYAFLQWFNGAAYFQDMWKLSAVCILLLFFSFSIGHIYVLPFLGIIGPIQLDGNENNDNNKDDNE
jgi:hypothetical protein